VPQVPICASLGSNKQRRLSALAWRNRMKLSAEQIRQFDDLGCVYFLAEYARAHRVASE